MVVDVPLSPSIKPLNQHGTPPSCRSAPLLALAARPASVLGRPPSGIAAIGRRHPGVEPPPAPSGGTRHSSSEPSCGRTGEPSGQVQTEYRASAGVSAARSRCSFATAALRAASGESTVLTRSGPLRRGESGRSHPARPHATVAHCWAPPSPHYSTRSPSNATTTATPSPPSSAPAHS
jgi:hypothetical protein